MANLIFSNIGAFINKLQSSLNAMNDNANEGLMDAGNAIMRKSKSECPHDTGALMKTGTVNKTDKNSVVLSYNTPYAVRMHEGTWYNFQKGRKAKYLEDPIKEMSGSIGEYIKRKITKI